MISTLQMNSLDGKNIIVVGGSTGIGLSGAKRLASLGARICLIGRNEENLQKACHALGDPTWFVAGDASKSSTVSSAIEQLASGSQTLYGLFHVAGGSGRKFGDGPLHEMTDEGIHYTLDLNLKSVIYSNRAAVQAFMRQKSSGVILNTGSVLGYSPSVPFFTTHAYAAAKSAIIGFSKSIAAYYAQHQIRVNVLAPALVETPMAQRACDNQDIMDFIRTKQPLDGGRVGQPDDLDGAVELLMTEAGKFISGQVLAVDGGWTISEGQIKTK